MKSTIYGIVISKFLIVLLELLFLELASLQSISVSSIPLIYLSSHRKALNSLLARFLRILRNFCFGQLLIAHSQIKKSHILVRTDFESSEVALNTLRISVVLIVASAQIEPNLRQCSSWMRNFFFPKFCTATQQSYSLPIEQSSKAKFFSAMQFIYAHVRCSSFPHQIDNGYPALLIHSLQTIPNSTSLKIQLSNAVRFSRSPLLGCFKRFLAAFLRVVSSRVSIDGDFSLFR